MIILSKINIIFNFFSYKICIEVLDGLRICFNTYLFRQLLVNTNEQVQYNEALKLTLQPPVNNNVQPETYDTFLF